MKKFQKSLIDLCSENKCGGVG